MNRYLVIDQISSAKPIAQDMAERNISAEIVEHKGVELLVWQTSPGRIRPSQTIYRDIQPISAPVLGNKGQVWTEQTLIWYSDEPNLSAPDRRHVVENVVVFDITIDDATEGLIDDYYMCLPVIYNCVDGCWHYHLG